LKYLEVYNKIRADIISGKYAPHTKLPHITELIQIFKVSNRTIQHAVRLLAEEKLVKGIPSKGTYVQDIKTKYLYGTSAGVSNTAVLISNYLCNMIKLPYFVKIFTGIEESLQKPGQRLHLVSCRDRSFQEIWSELKALEINSIITVDFEDHAILREIEDLRMPVIHLDLLDFKSRKHAIVANNYQGGELALEKLYELGHRRILYLYPFLSKMKRDEHIGRLRFHGIHGQAKKHKIRTLKKELVTIDTQDTRSLIKDLLARYKAYTGIIVSGITLFNNLKKVLEERDLLDTREMDVVVFSLLPGPEFIHHKPVWFCRWDGELMGSLAVKTLPDETGSFPRMQYLPMAVERNI
jgi:GntR family transcriptional regulator of arabinose operon